MPFKKMTPHLLTLIGIKLNESISPCSYNNASINWVYLYTALLAYLVLNFSRPFFPPSHCFSFLLLTAFLSVVSLPFFPAFHCISVRFLTALLSFFSLSFFPSSHCPSFLLHSHDEQNESTKVNVRFTNGEEREIPKSAVTVQKSRSPIDAWPDSFIFFDR